jgi:leader peptidase (prepilin peptidase) / N-methyltransferase
MSLSLIFENLPNGLVFSLVLLLGIIIGSFLNVYLYRFHTGRSLGGNSHCLSCGTRLKAVELVPLFSYLALRGRCRTCSSYIPSRYFFVELITGVLFLGTYIAAETWPLFLFGCFMVTLLVVIAVYDYYHMVIPDEFVFTATVTAFLLWLYQLATYSADLESFVLSLGAALLASGFLYVLWRVSDGAWIGFGDVKLIFPLALGVGYGSVFSLVVLSFWIGAGFGLLMLFAQRIIKRGQPHLRLLNKELTIKSAVPFAPFLILAYLALYFFNIDVVSFLSYA